MTSKYGHNLATAQEQQEAVPTYWIRINPGASQSGVQHYFPDRIAVPANITIEWLNNDIGQIHTVTSGNPGDMDAGAMFDSGTMRFGANFRATFDNASGLMGEVPYYCTVHPWVSGSVAVNDDVVKGENIEMASGTGSVLDLTKDNRTIFVFRPIAISEQQVAEAFPGNPVFYNFTLLRDKDNATIISSQFDPPRLDLQIEIVQVAPESNGTQSEPTISADAGGFRIQGDVFSEPGNYTMVTEGLGVGATTPPQQMRDEFHISVVSNRTG
jgi:plastocyanin